MYSVQLIWSDIEKQVCVNFFIFTKYNARGGGKHPLGV